jgi:hypothetical protein
MLWTAPPPVRECHGCGRCYGSHVSDPTIPHVKQITSSLAIIKMGLPAFLELATNSDDLYRRQVEEADREARLAKSELDRAAWLRVAQGWRSLLRRRPQSEEEAFDAQTKAKGKGQDDSQSSN